MKITLNQDPSFSETEVIINCPQPDEDILRLVAMLRIHQKKLVGILDGERRLLDVKDILYIDTADKRTFLYTGSTSWRTASGSWTFSGRAGPSSSTSGGSRPSARSWGAGFWSPWTTESRCTSPASTPAT